MIVLKPSDWNTVKSGLTPGSAVAPAYEAKMTADAFDGCAPA